MSEKFLVCEKLCHMICFLNFISSINAQNALSLLLSNVNGSMMIEKKCFTFLAQRCDNVHHLSQRTAKCFQPLTHSQGDRCYSAQYLLCVKFGDLPPFLPCRIHLCDLMLLSPSCNILLWRLFIIALQESVLFFFSPFQLKGTGEHLDHEINRRSISFNSEEVFEDYLSVGNVIGEMGVLTGRPRNATVTCETAVMVSRCSSLSSSSHSILPLVSW